MGLRALLVFGLIFFFSYGTSAQKKSKKKKRQSEELLIHADLFDFKNVNRIPLYYNKNASEKILKFEEQKNWEELFPVLEDYIRNFAIQNFYKDTYWLWRFAKLTELYGKHEDAIALYQLVLKHHRQDIDIESIEIYYDSLTQNDRDYFVPLDYYYELVEYRKEVDTLRPPRGVLLNMGANVNSNYSDYGPTLSINNDLMLLTSKRNIVVRDFSEVENEDLFFSKNSDGFWEESKPLTEVNTPYNEGSGCLSKDGQTLYFARCDAPNVYGNCDIFSAKRQEDGSWGNITNLGINVNSIAWDSHPSLSHGDDTLFFASDRIGGFGLSDIYFTTKDSEGNWTTAQNVGPYINSRANEVSPFYHPRFDILYFSSNGHLLNFGEFDIFKSNWQDTRWGEPKNIGPLVNGTGSEFYFTIDSDSRNLYYAHSAETDLKNLDLFSFPLPMAAQPGATATVTGTLVDNVTREPFKGIVSIIDLNSGIEVAPKFLRPDGSFEFNLINNQNYLLILQGEEFFRIEEVFFLDGDANFDLMTDHISSKMKFESIEFEVEKADILPSMYGDLNKIVNFLLDNPDFTLKIGGHTDSHGTPEFNLDLSKRRAEAIQSFIVDFGGIEMERVGAEGYGNTQPIVEEVTEDDKKLNRRVEFEINREALDAN